MPTTIWIFFLLPLIPALMSLAIPYYDQRQLFITACVYFGYVIIISVGKVIGKRLKRFDSLKFMGYMSFTGFSVFLIIPLVKVFDGRIFIQFLLISIWLFLHFIFVVKCEVLFKIVIPSANETRSKWTIVYYGIFLVLFVISGSGNFLITRNMSETFGETITLSYLTHILYVVGCWLGTLAGVLSIGVQGKLPTNRNKKLINKGNLVKKNKFNKFRGFE